MLNWTIKKAFNCVGLEVRRAWQNPRSNLLGLRSLGIRTVLDVGANEGQFAKYIIKALPNLVSVYSFEPLPGVFASLQSWAESAVRKVTVIPFNVGLGEDNEQLEMFEHVEITGHSSILSTNARSHELYPQTRSQKRVQVSIVRLDDFLEAHPIKSPPEILLKMDVQGYENRVLRGAPRLLAQARACLTEVNFDPLYESQASFEELAGILKRAGYRYAGCYCQGFASDGHVITADELFVR